MTALWLFLRAYWKPLCVLVLLIAAIATLDHWGNTRERAGYEKRQAEDAKALIAANDRADRASKNLRDATAENANELQRKLSSIQDSYDVPLPAVRLCSNASYRIEMHRNPNSPSGHDAAAEGDRFQRDLAPDIARLLRAADTQTAQLIACQAYVKSLRQ
jgi:hypothetical protein